MERAKTKNIKFFWRMVESSIGRRKARMLTALLAIAMGATILSGLITIYYDIPRQLGKEFRSYGANMIVIPKSQDDRIDDKHIDEIKKLAGDKLVGIAPYIYQNAKINEQPFVIAATNFDGLKKNSPFWLVDGDWPSEKRTVMIGHEISKKLGLKIGDPFVLSTPKENSQEMRDSDFTVSSIVTTGGKEEDLIFMSIEDIRSIMGDLNINIIECSIDANSEELQAIADNINEIDSAVSARLVKRVTESQGVVLEKLQALVWIVTIIVLFIMMICVSTTMMAVVAERRKEIGLKKALGAQNKSIIYDFLGEGFLLGLMGGALGSLLGYLFASEVSRRVFARSVNFLWALVPITIIASIVITIVACIIPVKTATAVDPALVLRGE